MFKEQAIDLYDVAQEVEFPDGLIGIENAKKFRFLNHSVQKYKGFYIMQCVSEEHSDARFLVLPLMNASVISVFYKYEDIQKAMEETQISSQDACVLLITKRDENGEVVYLNLQAPIFLNLKSMKAMQFVLPESYQANYKVSL